MKIYSFAITVLLAPLAKGKLENLERPQPKELVYSEYSSLPDAESDLAMFEDSYYDRDEQDSEVVPTRGRALKKRRVSYYSKKSSYSKKTTTTTTYRAPTYKKVYKPKKYKTVYVPPSKPKKKRRSRSSYYNPSVSINVRAKRYDPPRKDEGEVCFGDGDCKTSCCARNLMNTFGYTMYNYQYNQQTYVAY